MAEEIENSIVEISVGSNRLKVTGSEKFISEELETILDKVDMTSHSSPIAAESDGGTASLEPESEKSGKQSKLFEETETGKSGPTEEVGGNSELSRVASRINVNISSLKKYFYIDGEEVHIQDPMNIKQKYALLGYCTIKEIVTGEQYHDNAETKRKLIDVEKVNIGDWGGELLYNLRQEGSIKDNPNTEKQRNKPFKITPNGREELVNWLNEDN